jgi:uncharacterized protein (UPF0333 family)
MKGDNMGVSVFIVAILCLGVVGVYMYYKAETNSYNTLVEKIHAMQNEIHSNADSIKAITEMIDTQREVNQLMSEGNKKTVAELESIDSEIDKLQEHIVRMRESIQNKNEKPLMLDLKWPTSPMVVEVSKLPARKKIHESETKMVKTKTGLIHKTKSRSLERTVTPKATLPGLKESKHTLKAMDL